MTQTQRVRVNTVQVLELNLRKVYSCAAINWQKFSPQNTKFGQAS